MEKTWIVVAEGSRARVLAARHAGQPLTEILDFEFPEGRLRDQDIYTDHPGSTQGPTRSSRSATEQRDVRAQQHAGFARLIADALDKARNDGDYQRLMLVAPPAFLGALRDALDGPMEKLVDKTVQKNLVEEDEATIRGYLFG